MIPLHPLGKFTTRVACVVCDQVVTVGMWNDQGAFPLEHYTGRGKLCDGAARPSRVFFY